MSEWHPIETAPKNGTLVLLFAAYKDRDDYEGHPPRFIVGAWEDGVWCDEDGAWSDYHGALLYPTHWMPIPEPPEGDMPK